MLGKKTIATMLIGASLVGGVTYVSQKEQIDSLVQTMGQKIASATATIRTSISDMQDLKSKYQTEIEKTETAIKEVERLEAELTKANKEQTEILEGLQAFDTLQVQTLEIAKQAYDRQVEEGIKRDVLPTLNERAEASQQKIEQIRQGLEE